MRAAFLAIALDVARSAEEAALAREAHRRYARDDIGEPGRDRERRMLQRIGDEAAVQPGLVHVADVEPECFGDAIVVDPERPAEMDRKAVDVVAFKSRHRRALP